MRIASVFASLGLFALFATAVVPQDAAAQATQADVRFLEKTLPLLEMNMRAARIAADRAQDRDVRVYADQAADWLRGVDADIRNSARDRKVDERATRVEL